MLALLRRAPRRRGYLHREGLGPVSIDGNASRCRVVTSHEVLPRVLNYGVQLAVPRPESGWEHADGRLDMVALLEEFQRFWRRRSDAWETKGDYPEVFPRLLLMAFLQRVLNGWGTISREYAAGRRRMDLFVEYGGKGYVIELKLIHPSEGRKATLE